MSIFKAQIRWEGYPKTLKVEADSYADARDLAEKYASTLGEGYLVHSIKKAMPSTSKLGVSDVFTTFSFLHCHVDDVYVFGLTATKSIHPYDYDNLVEVGTVAAWRERPTGLQILMAMGVDFSDEAILEIEKGIVHYPDEDGLVCNFLVVSVAE